MIKKIGTLFRESSEKHIKDCLKSANCFFIVKYSGVGSPDMSSLRMSLKDVRADLFVVKNSIARRALKSAGKEDLVKNIEGPCGLVFMKDQPVDASKILYNFTKEHEQLVLEAGFLEDRLLVKNDIEILAKLPSKEALRAKLVMTLNAPISSLVMVLNNSLRKFVVCLDKIREKKAKEAK